MPRLWLILALCVEGALSAAWQVVARVRQDTAARLVTHGALLTGCVLFSFPFVWLVGTSFKYDEEIFVYPPRWVPAAPQHVDASPYVTAESLEPLRPPEGLERQRWPEVWQELEPRLWQCGSALVGTADTVGLEPGQVRSVLTHGLFVQAARGVPRALWAAPTLRLAEAVLARIDAPLVSSVWERVHRALELRTPSVRDTGYRIHVLGDSAASAWQSVVGAVRLVRGPATQSGPAATTVAYDLTQGDRVAVEAVLPLPVPAPELQSVTLPIRQDRSWHRLRVELEMDGRRWAARDALYLGQYRWQELTFKRAEADARDERDLGIWPLEPVPAAADAFAEPGRFRLRLTVERAGELAATLRKCANAYRSAWLATEHRWRYVTNSFYLVALTIVGQVLSCSLVAYAFARLRWPGRDVLFGLLLATMMLPGQVTMIPVFMVFRHLGWYNTPKALWVPSFFGSAFFIFLLRQFMRAIPTDLEDAARIDGCSVFGIYWRIVLPLTKPALAAVCIFTFMGTWNDFMGPLIYVNDQRLYPLALGLFDFRTEHTTEYGMLMAASTLMSLPVIAVFFLAQRYFIQGVTLTGMKG